jgi:hypothetical protein
MFVLFSLNLEDQETDLWGSEECLVLDLFSRFGPWSIAPAIPDVWEAASLGRRETLTGTTGSTQRPQSCDEAILAKTAHFGSLTERTAQWAREGSSMSGDIAAPSNSNRHRHVGFNHVAELCTSSLPMSTTTGAPCRIWLGELWSRSEGGISDRSSIRQTGPFLGSSDGCIRAAGCGRVSVDEKIPVGEFHGRTTPTRKD